jgi:hypothetical protein
MKSVEPPGGKETTTRMGRCGDAWEYAADVNPSVAASTMAPAIGFTISPP